jgi:regulator of RNase E activity RraA
MDDYSTCEISDALIKLGVEHGGLLPDIYCVSPGTSSSVRIEGPAYTVKMVLFNDAAAPKPKAHFVDAAKEGHIIVIDAPLSKSCISRCTCLTSTKR